MSTLRVMTYNVRSLRDSPRAVAAVVLRAEPDVLCVQETPRFLFWRARRRRLADRCGLRLVAGVRSRRVAVSVLVRLGLELVDVDEWLLPLTPGLHRRSAAAVTVRTEGRDVHIVSVHLGLDQTERIRHAALIRQRTAGHEGLVLAGDLNDLPGSRTWETLGDGLTDAWPAGGTGPGLTFSTRRPRRRIDAVLVSPSLGVVTARVLDDQAVRRASDHRPLVVDLAVANLSG